MAAGSVGQESTPRYYPVGLALRGKCCVVAGGGTVALRKVRSLLEYGARVTVISPELCPEINKLKESGKVTILSRSFVSGDLEGAFLVVAATNDNVVNQQVVAEARQARVWVNVVDKPELCDFILPASFSRGDLVVAVFTSGKSPALARRIKEKLYAELGPEYAELTELVAGVRAELKSSGVALNRLNWQSALDLDSLLKLIREGKTRQAKSRLLESLKNPKI